MSLIKAGLTDFNDNSNLASMYSCSKYWQCPLHPASCDELGIIVPQERFVSTRVPLGLENAFANFNRRYHHYAKIWSMHSRYGWTTLQSCNNLIPSYWIALSNSLTYACSTISAYQPNNTCSTKWMSNDADASLTAIAIVCTVELWRQSAICKIQCSQVSYIGSGIGIDGWARSFLIFFGKFNLSMSYFRSRNSI